MAPLRKFQLNSGRLLMKQSNNHILFFFNREVAKVFAKGAEWTFLCVHCAFFALRLNPYNPFTTRLIPFLNKATLKFINNPNL